MERSEPRPETEPTGGCFDRPFSSLTVDDVYDIAKVIGSELERIIDGCGKESVVGLVPRMIKVLELLESFASMNHAHKLREDELLKTFETLQLQQQKKRGAEESIDEAELQELQQKQQEWRKRCEELQVQVQQLQQDQDVLQARLSGSHAQEDHVQRQEREVMLKLKEVVDRQRDELRAKAQQNSTTSKEVEALQEQLERFMEKNAELRHRQNVLQAQLKSTVERKADMETDLKERNKEIENLLAQLYRTSTMNPSGQHHRTSESTKASLVDLRDPDLPCFSKKEVRDIIFERNELKTNLFLVQEELSYYQREVLNEERCPGFLLEAVRSAINKRRKVIKAKMLGIPVNECSSSDEEERSSLYGQTEVDGIEADKPAESRIRNLFGFLTWSGGSGGSGGRGTAHMSSSASAWEIIGDSEGSNETEQPPTS